MDAPVVGRLALPVRHRSELPVPTVPDVSLKTVEFETLKPDEVKAVLAIDVSNGNAFALSALDLDLGLTLAGTRILGTKTPRATKVEAGKTTRIEIPVSFSPLAAGLATYSMLTGSGATYGLSGTLAARTPFGDLALPVDVSGETTFSR